MNLCVRCKKNTRTKINYNSVKTDSVCWYYLPKSLCDFCIRKTLITNIEFKIKYRWVEQ